MRGKGPSRSAPGVPDYQSIRIDLATLVRGGNPERPHLVTRPTGREVRGEIEARLGPSAIGPATRSRLSVIDFSRIGVLDYSCADEVVAKLLLRHAPASGEFATHFFLDGVGEFHRDPIESVLSRHGLTVVVRSPGAGRAELLGVPTGEERDRWEEIEHQGRFPGEEDSLVRRLRARGVVVSAPHGESWSLSLLYSLLSSAG